MRYVYKCSSNILPTSGTICTTRTRVLYYTRRLPNLTDVQIDSKLSMYTPRNVNIMYTCIALILEISVWTKPVVRFTPILQQSSQVDLLNNLEASTVDNEQLYFSFPFRVEWSHFQNLPLITGVIFFSSSVFRTDFVVGPSSSDQELLSAYLWPRLKYTSIGRWYLL